MAGYRDKRHDEPVHEVERVPVVDGSGGLQTVPKQNLAQYLTDPRNEGSRIATKDDVAHFEASVAEGNRAASAWEDIYRPGAESFARSFTGGMSDAMDPYLHGLVGGDEAALERRRTLRADAQKSLPSATFGLAGDVAQMALLGGLEGAGARVAGIGEKAASVGERAAVEGAEGLEQQGVRGLARSAETSPRLGPRVYEGELIDPVEPGTGLARSQPKALPSGVQDAEFVESSSIPSQASPVRDSNGLLLSPGEQSAQMQLAHVADLEGELQTVKGLHQSAAQIAAERTTSPAVQALSRAAAEDSALARSYESRIEAALDAATEAKSAEAAAGRSLSPAAIQRASAAFQGAQAALRDDVSDWALEGRSLSVPHLMAAGLAGAALGLASHVGAEFAFKGLRGIAAKPIQEDASEIVKTLKGYGASSKTIQQIEKKFGSVQGFQKALEESGFRIEEFSPGKTFAAAERSEANAYNAIEDAVSRASKEGARPDVERLRQTLDQAIRGGSTVEEQKAINEVRRKLGLDGKPGVLQNVEKSSSPLDTLRQERIVADKMSKPDRIKVGTVADVKANVWSRVRRVMESEVKTVMESASPDLAQQYNQAKKAYMASSTLKRFTRDLDTKVASGVLSPQEAASRPSLGSAIGAILNPKWFAASLAMRAADNALGSAAKHLERVSTYVRAAVMAGEEAKNSVRFLMMTHAGVTADAGARTISSGPLKPLLNPAKFNKAIENLREGRVGSDALSAMGEVSQQHGAEAAQFQQAVKAAVDQYLPPTQAYPLSFGGKKKYLSVQPPYPEQMQALRFLDGLLSPFDVPRKVAAGTAGPEHMAALEQFYPDILQTMREELTRKMALSGASAVKSPEIRMSISRFLGQAVDPTTEQGFVEGIQQMYAEQESQKEEQKAPAPQDVNTEDNEKSYETVGDKVGK